MLKGLGIGKGDRVNIYLPMIPEAAVAMLACARIGAPHSVVFGGFSSQALADRINDAEAKLLITADGGYRRGAVFPLKPAADEALDVDDHDRARRRRPAAAATTSTMVDGRDHWYHELRRRPPTRRARPSRWTPRTCCSCSTRRARPASPKGIMHTTGGYLTQVTFTHKYVFDIHPETDVYWCTADVGWVTGHSYIVYGPLANATTIVMYEGVPNHPGNDRFWEIVEKYKVTKLYTAPTAIRTFMKWGVEEPAKHDLSSLRVIGSVGEPINPEAWMWYRERHRRRRVPGRRHVVADRDRRDHDQPAARGHHHQARLGDVPAARGSRPRWSTRTATRSTSVAATSRSPGRGRGCCGASGATPSATTRRTGAATPAATSPATAPSSTTTATCGCSAGSTT